MPFTPEELEYIKRQQADLAAARAAQAGGAPPIPPAPAPQPFPSALPTITLGPNVNRQRTQQEIGITASEAPVRKQILESQAGKAQLDLRKARIDQGLDPDTGKPLAGPNAGKIGPDALEGLSVGEVGIVKGITQGRVPVSSFAIARNPKLMKYIQLAFQYEPGTDLTTFQRRQAAATKFLSNPNSPMLRVNQALQHLDLFHANAHKLDNFHNGGLLNPFPAVGNYARAGAMALQRDPRFKAFQTDRDALAAELAAAFQGSGQGGALADREHWRDVLTSAQSPEAFDAAIKEAAGLLGGRIEASTAQFKQAVGANADMYDLMSPAAKRSYEKYTDPSFGEQKKLDKSAGEHIETNPETGLSTDYKRVPIPEGYQHDHDALLAHHPPGTLTPDQYRDIRKRLDEKYSDQLGGFHSTLDTKEVDDYVNGYNKGGVTKKIPAMNVPLSKVEHGAAEFLTSPAGTAGVNFANAALMGLPEGVSGQDRRDAFHALNAQNEGSAMVGDVLGSTLPLIGGEAALGRMAKMGFAKGLAMRPIARDFIANTAYQAGRGFNAADEGQGVEGAVEGAGAGATAALGGNLVTKGVTPFLSQAKQKALRALEGTDLTTFQRLGLGRAETSLTGLPGVHGAANRAMESYNINNSNRVLSNISPLITGVERKVPKGMSAGTDLNDFVHGQLSKAYGVISPQINGSVDKGFATAVRALKAAANTPEKRAMFKEIDEALKMFMDSKGNYTGESYRAASTRLRTLMQDFATRQENHGITAAGDVARLAEKARQQMQALIQRNNPAVAAQLKGVERGWAHQMRIEDATNRATGNLGVYSPEQYATSQRILDTTPGHRAFARGRALDQGYSKAGQQIMGSTIPKKVSPKETSVVISALGLGTFYTPAVAGVISGVAAGAYSPGVKRAVQLILSGRRPDNKAMAALRKVIEAGAGQYMQSNLPEEGKQ